MKKKRVLIFVVCYFAENSIESVLKRIPESVWGNERFDVEVLVIDDDSRDQTFQKAIAYAQQHRDIKITVLDNPKNLGYGGNQKVGYHYAIQNQFDIVVLLHGDGQYAPEFLDQMVSPILNDEADVVLGSRMMRKWDALKGRMPLYKWVGNQTLTLFQNIILGSKLSEFHTGYRAYHVSTLKSIPFEKNSDYFDFDTDILIQLIDNRKRIKEVPIPTFYGEEISRVNGFRYAYRIIRASVQSRIQKWGIFYDPKFDYVSDNIYSLKLGYLSSHEFALERIRAGSLVVDIGCGPGLMAIELNRRGAGTISIDQYINATTKEYSVQTIQANLDEYQFDFEAGHVDVVLVLDIIEHLKSPETFLRRLRERFCKDEPEIIITTGNVAFFLIRVGLLLGLFNYGKRGILDLTHTRLFSIGSLRRLLTYSGYEILKEKGIPAPFPLALGEHWLSRIMIKINEMLIYLSRGLFSYQIAFVAKPKPTLSLLLHRASQSSDAKRSHMNANL